MEELPPFSKYLTFISAIYILWDFFVIFDSKSKNYRLSKLIKYVIHKIKIYIIIKTTNKLVIQQMQSILNILDQASQYPVSEHDLAFKFK